MLLGIWKNIEELEDNINLDELQAILTASRDREHRRNKFFAAMKGIDLDEQATGDAQSRFDEVQRRVEAKLTGKSEQVLELDVFGLDIEEDE